MDLGEALAIPAVDKSSLHYMHVNGNFLNLL